MPPRIPLIDSLVKTSTAQFRSLMARVHSRQEERNILMAREIHDDVSQQLTALSIELSLLERRLGKNPEAVKVGELLQLVSGISGSVRKTMNELRPKVLDEFGLVAAIKYECQRYEKTQPRKVNFLSELEDVKLPDVYASEIFRLFQEMFLHSVDGKNGGEVRVELRGKRGQLQIDLQNDGAISATKSDDYKLRLLHIREHAERLGGSVKGQKGILSLNVPLKK